MLTLADIIEALSHRRPEHPGPIITEAVIDSRQVIPGALFVALLGERHDGHDFVGEAFERGAHVALVARAVDVGCPILDLRAKKQVTRPLGSPPERLEVRAPVCIRVDDTLLALQQAARFWRRKLDLRVVGITGSVGKSTTKELVGEVLEQRYRTLRNPGNQNNEIGLPLALLRLGEGYERAVLEMGFYVPGEIKLLCDMALPQVGVITNIGTVHAERAGDQETIARGKAELVQALPPAPVGTAILNFDDPWVRPMAAQTQGQVFFYGLSPEADLWADNVEGLGLEGIRLRLHYRNEIIHMRVPLIGRHSVHTVLRAAAVGLVEGLTWQEIVNGLRSEHTQLRLVAVRSDSGALILDDTYNASPESTLAALNLLDELEGRKVAVLGDMLELGAYEVQGHEMVGMRAAQVADVLVTVGQRAVVIALAARQGGLAPQAIYEVAESDEAIQLLHRLLRSRDIVLVKGSRGMQMDRIVTALESF
ncbi:MAG TPA: UDP-N-acetylmuramoyl-tripeptide--D-alanyl-D-alanine ligase [Anaerolineales bacterium]|nr:UDP-N-acetylmuramoyl-tripeptide--D-alanyl-D-alanine ligase [Anaerolineales bacterium]